MYNNIDLDHAITVITWWVKDIESKGHLPQGFPSHVVISATRIIMTINIFEFEHMFFLQLLGTVMGTSAAGMWAALYYAYYKVNIFGTSLDTLSIFLEFR